MQICRREYLVALVSTIFFVSQDGRSHLRVRRFGGNVFGSKWGANINESTEDTVVLLSQFSDIAFRVLNQIEILISPLKASMLMAFSLRFVMVCSKM